MSVVKNRQKQAILSVRSQTKVSLRGLEQGIAQRARVGFFARFDKATGGERSCLMALCKRKL